MDWILVAGLVGAVLFVRYVADLPAELTVWGLVALLAYQIIAR